MKFTMYTSQAKGFSVPKLYKIIYIHIFKEHLDLCLKYTGHSDITFIYTTPNQAAGSRDKNIYKSECIM